MQYPEHTPARLYDKGMGEAVANRTVNRKIDRPTSRIEQIEIPRRDDISLDSEVESYCKAHDLKIESYHVEKGDGETVKILLSVVADVETEKWEDVALRVALGNASMAPDCGVKGDYAFIPEYHALRHHMRQASILMSGRHLQHGDANQKSRNMEVFTNCATSPLTSLQFYLLLNGSGVGRCYDDAMMQVDWRQMPIVACVIDKSHPDVRSGEIPAHTLTLKDAKHMYRHLTTHVFEVPDTREGWAQAIEKLEVMAFAGCFRHDALILDFSKVRCKGSPIGGMQDRPASGPYPLMVAIDNVSRLRDAGMYPWRATMYADHYFAECVRVGGARRAARMATKTWRDRSVFGFIEVKRGGHLWTSNNSVTVDQEFWDLVKLEQPTEEMYADAEKHALWMHAHKVFDAVVWAAYNDKTGEPGFINVDKLTWNGEGTEVLLDGDFAESAKYKLMPETRLLTRALAQAWHRQAYKVITNPCGEIVLNALGGYCVIGDVVPFHAAFAHKHKMLAPEVMNVLWDDDAEDAFRVTTRALIRTNLMDSMYSKEVKRTNRIGVGMTGIHEYAWARFGYGWKKLVNEQASLDFWLMLSRFKRAVVAESKVYSEYLGVPVPHTDTTIKPAGTTSKLFGLTEGAHLPTMGEYLRWVQFTTGDPRIEEYSEKGYPVRVLQQYAGTTIIGFPTIPTICSLGMGYELVMAGDATPDEQYQYLRLLEKYWIVGVEEDGVTPLRDTGNQVSYTLKYKPEAVSFEEFKRTLLEGQSTIRCCSVMPQDDDGESAYEYLPEQPVTKAEFDLIVSAIKAGDDLKEEVGMEHVDCGTGGCPIDFKSQ